ncbi:MAG: nuclear transport factor 2 family protein [Actinomycetota bacterium]|nr:hypothetical protein [Acidimicrobiaceae bacterium]MCH2625681.1 nuclear transport factor 2 family protein [Acidimicrobiales bacterium]MEC7874086.1 nuclear transport factor 2 family protein [Actinomycetota bacterium]MEC8827163.1 nuclear transport factor 2 family protein [Actinomycetota bacterium]MEC8922707.1 nuclear transport factor 2 family protein [Actinomycetota bacterium]|tara:strand:+ start:2599 stop:2985 length:387 start_codon:yes stop_codon:yes gene_type:complete
MSSNEKIVKAFLYGADTSVFSDEGKLVNLLPEPIPFGGIYVGPAGADEYVNLIQSNIRLGHLKAHEIVNEGDRVIVIGSESGHFLHNDQPYEMDWVHVNTVVDGKILEMREYNDTAALLHAYNAPSSQ